MTRIYAFFIILLCTHSIAYAVVDGGVCDPLGSAEQQCDNDLYCQEMGDGQPHVCQPCPDSHPYSSQGQNNTIDLCYKTCDANPDFANGTWLPDESTVYYAEECQYTNSNNNNISCNNSDDPCIGFHLEAGTCVSNFKECSVSGDSGFKTYDNNTPGWSECFITQCAEGSHLENTENMCNRDYGTCVPDTNSCDSELSCDNGTITGTIRWQNNTYNYSDCKCNRTANLNYGTGTELCTWNGNTWSNCQITLETCIAGYWQGESENPTDCTQVSAGYYSAENELTRYACPAGSTSAADSDTKTDCYMTGGTTQICDGNTPANCFTLPNSVGNIYYHNGQ